MSTGLTYRDIHPAFKLNGFSYSKEELKEVAYSLIKEGLIFEREVGNFLQDWLSDSDSIEVSTSGSTGVPKSIFLKKQKMHNSALATGQFFGLAPEHTALLCLSPKYIAGKMMLVRGMVLGLEIDFVEPSSEPLLALQKNYDFAAMVPLQLEHSLAQLEQLKTLIVGGAPVSLLLRSRLGATRCQVFETYGMTETLTHVAVRQLNGQKGIPTSLFFNALPDIHFSIDTRNCLVINAPRLADKPIITNDVVELKSDTKFEWLGRFDNIINSGGIKLHPEKIEDMLASILNTNFFVHGFPDEKLGQKLVLIIEGQGNPELIMAKLGAMPSITKIGLPKDIFFVQKFSQTANGKIRRKKIVASLI